MCAAKSPSSVNQGQNIIVTANLSAPAMVGMSVMQASPSTARQMSKNSQTHPCASSNDNWRLSNQTVPACLVLSCPDGACDSFNRTVTLSAERVTIIRVVKKLAMRIHVPTQFYRGVALRLEETANLGWHYRLVLEHKDQDLCCTVYSADHDRDIIAIWHSYAKVLKLPRLIEDEDNDLKQVGDFSDILASPPHQRRKVFALTKHRPRFLRRRRCGKLGAKPVVIQNEAEIVARR